MIVGLWHHRWDPKLKWHIARDVHKAFMFDSPADLAELINTKSATPDLKTQMLNFAAQNMEIRFQVLCAKRSGRIQMKLVRLFDHQKMTRSRYSSQVVPFSMDNLCKNCKNKLEPYEKGILTKYLITKDNSNFEIAWF